MDLPDKPTPRTVTAKLGRMGPEEAAFETAFWRGIPAETRVELLWDMVLDALALKGELKVNRDYRDLFVACNDHEVRFLVVGAYAVTFHARPRFTKGLVTSPSCRDRSQPGRAQWLT